jgi:hypothetical protein
MRLVGGRVTDLAWCRGAVRTPARAVGVYKVSLMVAGGNKCRATCHVEAPAAQGSTILVPCEG